MKIQAINPFRYNIKSPQKTTSRPRAIAFRGLYDIFEPSFDNQIKNTTVEDMNGGKVEAKIFKTDFQTAISLLTQFMININGKEKGNAKIDSNCERGVFLDFLKTQEHTKRHYRGLGTELVKCASQESTKQGKNGIITTCAYNGMKPPFKFYFKNNFKIVHSNELDTNHQTLYNAPLQYATKYDKEIFELISDYNSTFFMELDEKGAKALLDGTRLYESRICDFVDRTIINGDLYTAWFIESPNENEYFLQVLNEYSDREQLCYIASLEPYEKNGKKHFKINEVSDDFKYSSDTVNNFAQYLIPQLEEKYL